MVKFILSSALVFSTTIASAQFEGIPSDLSSSLELLSKQQEKREDAVAATLTKNGEKVSDVRLIFGEYFTVQTDKCKYQVRSSDGSDITVIEKSKKCK